MPKKLTHEEFLKKANIVHHGDYEYLDEYKGMSIPITVRCKKCGRIFSITPNNHISKCQGCKYCANKQPNEAYDIDTWITMCQIKHEDYYQYDKSILNYKNGNSIVKIICPKHGVFECVARHHLHGHGCKECAKENYRKKHGKTHKQFLIDAHKIHGDKYEYLTEYVNAHTPMLIRCKKCGHIFPQTPHKHLNAKHGCSQCKHYKLEDIIDNFLILENVSFIKQYKTSWLKLLSLDFYLPEYNIAIECQGKQHFQEVKYFGGKEEFEKIVERDTRKRKLCEENGVKLLYFAEKEYKNAPYKVFIDKNELLNEIRSYDKSIRNTTTSS